VGQIENIWVLALSGLVFRMTQYANAV